MNVRCWFDARAILSDPLYAEMWVAFASTDCGACSREIVELGSAEVCGIDGLTYMRACLANCQDVAIAYHGICRDGSTAAADADAADLTAVGSTAPGGQVVSCVGLPLTGCFLPSFRHVAPGVH